LLAHPNGRWLLVANVEANERVASIQVLRIEPTLGALAKTTQDLKLSFKPGRLYWQDAQHALVLSTDGGHMLRLVMDAGSGH
jgi:hypothetical protein